MKNYNKQMRNLLSKYMESYLDQELTLFGSACKFAVILYSLECVSNKYIALFRKYLIYVMYLDAYKKVHTNRRNVSQVMKKLIFLDNFQKLKMQMSC